MRLGGLGGTPGGTAGNSAFGNLFDDYSVSSSSQLQDYGQNSFQRQGRSVPDALITGFSIFDGFCRQLSGCDRLPFL